MRDFLSPELGRDHLGHLMIDEVDDRDERRVSALATEDDSSAAPCEREIVRGTPPVMHRALRSVADLQLLAHTWIDDGNRYRERFFLARQHRLTARDVE